jgi:hypothetical protein
MASKNSVVNQANTRAAPAAVSSFSVQQQLATKISGSQKDTHAVSPLDELLALKSLKEMAATIADKILWQGYINNSIHIFHLAASAINQNLAIEEKLSMPGLQGMLALASLLKQRHADKVFDKVMDHPIGEGGEKGAEYAHKISLPLVKDRYTNVNNTTFVHDAN